MYFKQKAEPVVVDSCMYNIQLKFIVNRLFGTSDVANDCQGGF